MLSADQDLRHYFFSWFQTQLKWLFHKKLSHLNFKILSKIFGDELVRGTPKIKLHKDQLWSIYVKSKQTKSLFKKRSCFYINDRFNLLRVDLFCPVPIKPGAWKVFILVIFDEFSTYTWELFLTKKSHVVEEIISFLKRMKYCMMKRLGNFEVIMVHSLETLL